MYTKESIISKVKELLQANVVVKDEEELTNKLFHLAEDGVDRLHLISDFDDTLSKHTVNGKKTMNSYLIFSKTKTLTQSYLDKGNALFAKILPFLHDLDIKPEQQREVDQLLADLVALSIGEKVTISDVHEITDLITVPLKSGCEEMFGLLSELGVPLTIISAGSGDVIEHVIDGFNAVVKANFFKYEDGQISDVSEPIVGPYNKNTVLLPVYEKRPNVILLGDQIHDSRMANGLPNLKILLKIGFFYGTVNDKEILQKYLNHYDVLLLKDESLNTIIDLLRFLAENP